MRLTELEPEFLHTTDDDHSHTRVGNRKGEANGIIFSCPKCFNEKGNTLVGVHSVICWELSVAENINPKPGRWKMEGSGFDDLTLVNGSSSVSLNGGCNAHFYVRNGEIIMC